MPVRVRAPSVHIRMVVGAACGDSLETNALEVPINRHESAKMCVIESQKIFRRHISTVWMPKVLINFYNLAIRLVILLEAGDATL